MSEKPAKLEKLPKIITQLPGPKARQTLELDRRYVSQSYPRAYPFVAHRAEGAVIEDLDGNHFLDFNAGIAVCSTGHCHPDVVRAIQRQAAMLIHMSSTDFYYSLLPEFAMRLESLMPGQNEWRCFFGNSGAEAVEAAMKLARYYTGRQHFIAFHGAFHGRTFGALSLTSSKPVQRKGFSPLVAGVTHVPYANCYRCPLNLQHETCGTACAKYIEDVIFKTSINPDEVAAIILEPVQGEGGYIVPPKDFLETLEAIARKYGILLIADEVQSGMGRTGKMFAFEHFDFHPDIVTIAKGVASGMPLGVTIAREDIMNWEAGSHASTFGGNPVSLAAAMETIGLLEAQYMENAVNLGEFLLKRLRDLMAQETVIGDVRGLGLMIGIEIVKNRRTNEPATQLRDAIVQECFKRGLLVLGAGQSVIRFSPPLVIDAEQAEFAMFTFADAISAAKGTSVSLSIHS
jgi:4-aminobutyrate aminotransferase